MSFEKGYKDEEGKQFPPVCRRLMGGEYAAWSIAEQIEHVAMSLMAMSGVVPMCGDCEKKEKDEDKSEQPDDRPYG